MQAAFGKDVVNSMGPEEREFGRHTREESGHDYKCHVWECVWKIHKDQIGKALVNHTQKKNKKEGRGHTEWERKMRCERREAWR